MRQIDYRAWDTTTRKMIYDFSNFAGWQARHEMENSWKDDRYIKMQFTGLNDNSVPPKKIYEGDIVKKYDEQIDYTYIGDVTLGTINIEDAFGFVYTFMCWKAAEEPIDSSFEVIGNIFENPELLEE